MCTLESNVNKTELLQNTNLLSNISYQNKSWSVSSRKLKYQKTIIQQELKATSERLKHQKRLSEQRTLNKRFAMNPKSVYRQMKGDIKSSQKIILKEDVEFYWKYLWSKEVIHNDKVP